MMISPELIRAELGHNPGVLLIAEAVGTGSGESLLSFARPGCVTDSRRPNVVGRCQHRPGKESVVRGHPERRVVPDVPFDAY
jgi:hypothetical protein